MWATQACRCRGRFFSRSARCLQRLRNHNHAARTRWQHMHHFPKRPFSLKSALADYGSAHKKYRWVRVGNACTCVVVPKDLSRRTRTPAMLQRCSEFW